MIRQGRTDEFLQRRDVQKPLDLLTYSQQQIGTPIPIGPKQRSLAVKRLEEEMEAQRWTIDHLVAAIDYMKARGINARSFAFTFYHVEPAVKGGYMPRQHTNTWDELGAAVSEAVELEDDSTWVRRLCMARGAALQHVYDQWVRERQGQLVGGSEHAV